MLHRRGMSLIPQMISPSDSSQLQQPVSAACRFHTEDTPSRIPHTSPCQFHLLLYLSLVIFSLLLSLLLLITFKPSDYCQAFMLNFESCAVTAYLFNLTVTGLPPQSRDLQHHQRHKTVTTSDEFRTCQKNSLIHFPPRSFPQLLNHHDSQCMYVFNCLLFKSQQDILDVAVFILVYIYEVHNACTIFMQQL